MNSQHLIIKLLEDLSSQQKLHYFIIAMAIAEKIKLVNFMQLIIFMGKLVITGFII
jgi:hypothetical protein